MSTLLRTTNPEAAEAGESSQGSQVQVMTPEGQQVRGYAGDVDSERDLEARRSGNISPAWHRPQQYSAMNVTGQVPQEIMTGLVHDGFLDPINRSSHEHVWRALQKCVDYAAKAGIERAMEDSDREFQRAGDSWGHGPKGRERRKGT